MIPVGKDYRAVARLAYLTSRAQFFFFFLIHPSSTTKLIPEIIMRMPRKKCELYAGCKYILQWEKVNVFKLHWWFFFFGRKNRKTYLHTGLSYWLTRIFQFLFKPYLLHVCRWLSRWSSRICVHRHSWRLISLHP